jgi:hypothetical protein
MRAAAITIAIIVRIITLFNTFEKKYEKIKRIGKKEIKFNQRGDKRTNLTSKLNSKI